VSTFGNTGKHHPGPDPDRAERRLNPQAPRGLEGGGGRRKFYKKIPYPAGIQRSRIGVFLTSEEVRGDNDMEDEPLFIASLQGEGRSQI